MGLIACLLLPAYCGIPFVHTDPFHWLARPGILFDHISKYRATLCWLPNFAFEHLARIVRTDAAGDLGSVRAFINCSEPCKAQTFDRFLERFEENGLDSTKLQVCYAMAEAVFAVTQTPLGRPPSRFLADGEALRDGRAVPASSTSQAAQLLSAGPEIDGIEVRVLGADREEVPEGTLGELAIRGTFMFSGYYGNAELSDQKFKGDLYCTGDLGFKHGGEVYVLGRVDDLIIVNGKNIVAHEIERIAPDAHSEVKPGRVVAIPISHRDSGSDVLVLIAERIAGTSTPAAAMISAISDRVFSEIGVKPADVRIVDEGWLLKTTSGKISRKDNRIRYLSEFAPRWSADSDRTTVVDFARSE
jgi:acyl-CoA synthetase (AMP-forming)/AMP-acid ligase II